MTENENFGDNIRDFGAFIIAGSVAVIAVGAAACGVGAVWVGACAIAPIGTMSSAIGSIGFMVVAPLSKLGSEEEVSEKEVLRFAKGGAVVGLMFGLAADIMFGTLGLVPRRISDVLSANHAAIQSHQNQTFDCSLHRPFTVQTPKGSVTLICPR